MSSSAQGVSSPFTAHGHRLRAPVDAVQGLDGLHTGLRLVRRGDGVFQVEEERVGGAGSGLLEEVRPRGRHGELAALQAAGRVAGPAAGKGEVGCMGQASAGSRAGA
jgi:hypothetical protein